MALDRAVLKRDEDVTFRVAVPMTQSATPTIIAARVVCLERAVVHQGRFVHVKEQIVRDMPLEIPVTLQSSGSGSIMVRFAADVWPASGPGKSLNFNYRWQLLVELSGASKCAMVFPLAVL